MSQVSVSNSNPQSAGAVGSGGGVSSPRANADDPATSPSSSSFPPPPAAEIAAAELPGVLEHGDVDNAFVKGKKPAWNIPSSGSCEAGSVMDAISRLVLSEATRASPKSCSSDSLKSLSDGSISAPRESVTASSPMVLNANPGNPSSEQIRCGEGNAGVFDASDNGGSPQHRLPPSSATVHHQSSPEFLPNNVPNRSNNNWDHGPRNGDHYRGNSGNRQGSNGGGRYRNRRDHERGGHGWNSPRNPMGRYPQPMLPHQQRSPPPQFLWPQPPVQVPYNGLPLQVQPFWGPVAYPEMAFPRYIPPQPPFETPRSMQFIPQQTQHAPSSGMFHTVADHMLAIAKQIEYYFSPENLCKDIYLRQNMNEQGWVPISVIADFRRIRQLSGNLHFILDAVRPSSIVEVQGEKIRRRNDWRTWVLRQPSNQSDAASGSHSASSSASSSNNLVPQDGAANGSNRRVSSGN